MVFQTALRSANLNGIDKSMADPTFTTTSTGTLSFKRAKRDGRNPSTGARTSRRFWSTFYWLEGILPLTQGNGNFIY